MSCRVHTPPPEGLCRGLTMYHTVDVENPNPPPPDCTDCDEWALTQYNPELDVGKFLGGAFPHFVWDPDTKDTTSWKNFLAAVADIRELDLCDVPFDFEIRLLSSSLPGPDNYVVLSVEDFIAATIADLEAAYPTFDSAANSSVYFNCDDQSMPEGDPFDYDPRVTPVYHRDVRGDAIGGHFADPTDAAYAALAVKDLTLTRTNRSTGANLDAADGVENGANGLDWFNGSGVTTIPAGEWRTDKDGDGFAVGVLWWAAAANALADQPGGDVGAQPQQIIGLGGEKSANPTVQSGTRIYLEDQTAADYQIIVEQIGGSSWNLPTFDANGRAPFLLVASVWRIRGGVWLHLYRDGTAFGDPIALDPALIDTDWLTVGDPVKSDGGWHQMAAWCRPLRASEVGFLGGVLTSLVICDGCIGNFGNPLLTECGKSAIDPQWIVPRSDRSAVLVAQGHHRHTRLADQYRPRRYALHWELDNGHDVELVRQVIEQTKGCTITRWRHPVDDPIGPICAAPRWVILNADQLRQMFTARRGRPHVAAFDLELEEVI